MMRGVRRHLLLLRKIIPAMAAIFADAVVFGCKALSRESSPSSYNEQSVHLAAKTCDYSRPQDPCVCSRQDFIIFAEFSEVMGPVPLLTIPLHAEESAGIEISNFIMRIMSVDYHANSSESVFCEDAQVLQMFIMPDLHAYVHYLTLHDPMARGFVRPLCLAYVTADQYKLSQIFPVLRKQFLQVMQIVKHDNRLWFKDEISSILHCIKETQNKYLYWKKKEEDGFVLSDEGQQILEQTNMDQLVQQSTDYTHMLHALGPLLRADGGVSDEVLAHWKCGFAQADKADMILSVLFTDSHHKEVGSSLKGVLALSPWGLSAAVWNLVLLLRHHRECRLKPGCITGSAEDDQIVLNDGVEEALSDLEYLQLIDSLARPPYLTVHKTTLQDADLSNSYNIQRNLEILEANIMSGGNEVASSYHSVPESLSEVLAGATISQNDGEDEVNRAEEALPDLNCYDLDTTRSDTSSNDSFLDISETSCGNSDKWNAASPEQTEDKKSHCLWNCQKSGSGILKFFQVYGKVAHHLLYSLLIGRTIVLVGKHSCEDKASHIMNVLSPYVPVMSGQEVRILRWHCGILVPSHISSYHMIGVCVPERLSEHDMISFKDKNSVTMLNISSKQLFGPAYSGRLLGSLEHTAQHMQSDQSLMLLLHTIATTLNEKLFMYLMLLKKKLVSAKAHSRHSPGSDVLKDLGLDGCDAEIVRYLSKVGSVNWIPML